MAKLTPDNAVHLKDWDFSNGPQISQMGFRKVGQEYVRVDMAERLIKQAHEAPVGGRYFCDRSGACYVTWFVGRRPPHAARNGRLCQNQRSGC